MVLSEWHLTPEYLQENWTEEILQLMLEARIDRLKRLRPSQEEPKLEKTYVPQNHKDAVGLINKMQGFGSRTMSVTTVVV